MHCFFTQTLYILLLHYLLLIYTFPVIHLTSKYVVLQHVFMKTFEMQSVRSLHRLVHYKDTIARLHMVDEEIDARKESAIMGESTQKGKGN